MIINDSRKRPELGIDNLILRSDTDCVKSSQAASDKVWQKTPVPNLVRYALSGVLFARIRVKGKLIRRSLKTQVLSVAKLRLADLEKSERHAAGHSTGYVEGKMTFANALEVYEQRLEGDASPKPRTKQHQKERIRVLLKTWPSLGKMDVGKGRVRFSARSRVACLEWEQANLQPE